MNTAHIQPNGGSVLMFTRAMSATGERVAEELEAEEEVGSRCICTHAHAHARTHARQTHTHTHTHRRSSVWRR